MQLSAHAHNSVPSQDKTALHAMAHLLVAKVRDDRSNKQISFALRATYDEHYTGVTAQRAKELAMVKLNSKPAFTHVTLEPTPQPALEQALKTQLKLNPSALMHQRIYNPLHAEFRGYSELSINGFVVKYALRTSGFCAYAVVEAPACESNEKPTKITSLRPAQQG